MANCPCKDCKPEDKGKYEKYINAKIASLRKKNSVSKKLAD